MRENYKVNNKKKIKQKTEFKIIGQIFSSPYIRCRSTKQAHIKK